MDRQEWLEERRKGIGGSDWTNALALAPYGCQRKLVYDKRGTEPDFPAGEPEGYLTRGHKMEPLVVAEAEERLEIKLRRQTRLNRPDWLPAWWVGNVDRMVVGGGVFEAKTKNPWSFRELERSGVPVGELAQCQHYMALANRDECLYFVLEPVSWRVYHTLIARDPELIKNMLTAGEWLWGAVENGPLPARLDASSRQCKNCEWRWTCQGEALFKTKPSDEPAERFPIQDDEICRLTAEAYEIRELMSDAADRLETIKEKVKAHLLRVVGKPPVRATIEGHAINWLKYNETRMQTAPFKKAHPDLFAQFSKVTVKEAFRWD